MACECSKLVWAPEMMSMEHHPECASLSLYKAFSDGLTPEQYGARVSVTPNPKHPASCLCPGCISGVGVDITATPNPDYPPVTFGGEEASRLISDRPGDDWDWGSCHAHRDIQIGIYPKGYHQKNGHCQNFKVGEPFDVVHERASKEWWERNTKTAGLEDRDVTGLLSVESLMAKVKERLAEFCPSSFDDAALLGVIKEADKSVLNCIMNRGTTGDPVQIKWNVEPREVDPDAYEPEVWDADRLKLRTRNRHCGVARAAIEAVDSWESMGATSIPDGVYARLSLGGGREICTLEPYEKFLEWWLENG